MARRYAPDHKALVLKILVANKGDISATSRFTGVPKRTLRDWVHEIPPAVRARLATNNAAATRKKKKRRF